MTDLPIREPDQTVFDAGAKHLLLPTVEIAEIATIPGELFATFQTGFYADPET